MSTIERIFPSASYTATLVSPMATAPFSADFCKSLNMEFNAVPAVLPLIPLFANIPKTAEVSSRLFPADDAAGPAIRSASDNCSTFVFDLACAAANTSDACEAFSASIPNIDIISVTISDAVAKSSCPAVAKFKTDGKAEVICSTSQPAKAIYPKASADSEALYLVVAPISRATALSVSISSAVAPEIACTLLILVSYCEPTAIAIPPSATNGAVTLFMSVEPASRIFLLPSSNFETDS